MCVGTIFLPPATNVADDVACMSLSSDTVDTLIQNTTKADM